MSNKRLRVDTVQTPVPLPINTNATVPETPPPLRRQPSSGLVPIDAGATAAVRNAADKSAEKVEAILTRYNKSFCDELGVDLASNSPEALWQWFCASILMSARIKTAAGLGACKALLRKGYNSPAAMKRVNKEQCQALLRDNGYEDKTADFLIDDAKMLLNEHNGNLNGLREKAIRTPAVERTLLKKYRGVGDGGVDIFFREVQLVWDEIFPFADKKALKAARLVGLREHPQSLAALVDNDRAKYVRLLDGLVRIELTKTYKDF